MTHYGRRQIIAVMVAAWIVAVWSLCPAIDLEVWWKYPGGKYWHRSCEITDKGVSEVEPIPNGAIVAIRDRETCTLVVLSKGE